MANKISFQCPCGKQLSADAAHANRRAKCPKCGQVARIPALPAQSEKRVAEGRRGVSLPTPASKSASHGGNSPIPTAAGTRSSSESNEQTRKSAKNDRVKIGPSAKAIATHAPSIWDEVDLELEPPEVSAGGDTVGASGMSPMSGTAFGPVSRYLSNAKNYAQWAIWAAVGMYLTIAFFAGMKSNVGAIPLITFPMTIGVPIAFFSSICYYFLLLVSYPTKAFGLIWFVILVAVGQKRLARAWMHRLGLEKSQVPSMKWPLRILTFGVALILLGVASAFLVAFGGWLTGQPKMGT